MSRKWRSIVTIMACAGWIAGFCGAGPAAAAPHGHGGGGMAGMGNHAPLVRTEKAGMAAISQEIELTGSVEATRIARLASPGEGPVRNSQWREGDRVHQGEVLVEIGRATAAAAELTAMRQLLQEQEQEFHRMETLVAAGAVPAADLETARSKYENARAQAARARQNSEDYRIKAPWAGIVAKVLVKDGDYVAPRMTLVEMYDPASLVVRFAAPEAQAMSLGKGMEVKVGLDAYPDRIWRGKINRIYPELEPRTRTRTVEAVLAGPVTLLPGMFARLTVEQGTTEGAITVPAAALIPTPHQGYAVYVVEEEKARRRQVEIGLEAGGVIHILSGVRAGEEVIIAGHEKLKDGSPVRLAGMGRGGHGSPGSADAAHPGRQPGDQQSGHQSDHQPGQQSGHQPDHQPDQQPKNQSAHQAGHQSGHQQNHQPIHQSAPGGHGQ